MHSTACLEITGIGAGLYGCSVEESYEHEADVNDIETISFLTICFQDPEAAEYHDVLAGFDGIQFRNYKRNSPYRGFTGKLRRYKFYGLHIRETWKVERICAVAAVLVAVVVMAGKVFWASWEVVFGAGSFFVAVPMLILAVLSYYE
ncbi:hypothetical protein B0J12DRAFT_227971 [Macrophomina phaseolina]|uniref:Uncharacterized protein n=1 Tax=Macrophomina phaseolina TaxID=35725 RepID=A0ABQ8GPQ3_9PEZI|nr:hypothetical protein B0J12DRAFT_227971 [Macrophomina phaseolina]